MSEDMIFSIIGVIVVSFFIYRFLIQNRNEEKNKLSDRMNQLLKMSPNDFASKVISVKVAEFISPDIKNMNLPEDIKNEFVRSATKYMFEMSILLLYYAYEVSKARKKTISYENILNFAVKSALSSMGMLAFGIEKDFNDKYKIILKNRFELYSNKSDYQIKNIFSNICVEEIKKGYYYASREVLDNTMSGMPLMVEHLNNLFAGRDLYLCSELIFMYIDYNRNNLESLEDDSDTKTERIETLMYDIDRPEPSQFFVETRKLVGNWLQQRMDQTEGTRWIKGYLTYPAFEHLSFSYKNQIFCVVVEILDDKTKKSYLPEKTKDLLIKECNRNNLIPCLYKVLVDNPENPAYNTLRPYSDGWNLYNAKNGEPVIPERLGNNDLVKMSEWELNDFAIQVVRNYITDNLKLKVMSYQNIVGIDPQLWFEDDNRKRHYVIVRYTMYPNKNADLPNNLAGIQNKCKGFDGFFASVAFCSKGENPSILYRGQESFISFEGLKKLEPIANLPSLPFEELALDISAKVANTLYNFDLSDLTEDERLYYLFIYSTELLIGIYSNVIVRKNTSVNENELFPLFMAYLEKITPPNHRGLVDWTNVVMSRSKIYRQMMHYNKTDYSTTFTKLCQHEIENGTFYTYESVDNIPTTSYKDKLNMFYTEIEKTNIIKDITKIIENSL